MPARPSGKAKPGIHRMPQEAANTYRIAKPLFSSGLIQRLRFGFPSTRVPGITLVL
jgi:hypothetical protein